MPRKFHLSVCFLLFGFCFLYLVSQADRLHFKIASVVRELVRQEAAGSVRSVFNVRYLIIPPNNYPAILCILSSKILRKLASFIGQNFLFEVHR